MIKAVFFDQDNTIIKTKEAAGFAYEAVFRELSSEFNIEFEESYSTWQSIVSEIKDSKDPQKRFFEYSLKETFDRLDLPPYQISIYLELFYETLSQKVELNDGTLELLESLKFLKILFTEDSSKQNQIKINKFGLDRHFDMIITSDDTLVMKPDIKYLQIAWKYLDLYPNECLYVGDNWEKDCELGQEGGGIGVLLGTQDKRADFCIEKLNELPNILKQLNY